MGEAVSLGDPAYRGSFLVWRLYRRTYGFFSLTSGKTGFTSRESPCTSYGFLERNNEVFSQSGLFLLEPSKTVLKVQSTVSPLPLPHSSAPITLTGTEPIPLPQDLQ